MINCWCGATHWKIFFYWSGAWTNGREKVNPYLIVAILSFCDHSTTWGEIIWAPIISRAVVCHCMLWILFSDGFIVSWWHTHCFRNRTWRLHRIQCCNCETTFGIFSPSKIPSRIANINPIASFCWELGGGRSLTQTRCSGRKCTWWYRLHLGWTCTCRWLCTRWCDRECRRSWSWSCTRCRRQWMYLGGSLLYTLFDAERMYIIFSYLIVVSGG